MPPAKAPAYPEITERIAAEIDRQGRSKAVVSELAGIVPSTFYTRCQRGDWTTSDLAAIARVLRVAPEALTEETT